MDGDGATPRRRRPTRFVPKMESRFKRGGAVTDAKAPGSIPVICSLCPWTDPAPLGPVSGKGKERGQWRMAFLAKPRRVQTTFKSSSRTVDIVGGYFSSGSFRQFEKMVHPLYGDVNGQGGEAVKEFDFIRL
ncbi:hypothetical protein NHX12_014243 [Muraenolepis orangiensis]|uniref:Uncharacterized protein n=1 Tax=Muraenolepis orangiensis TaxID=630683 RepID=A0A9Q0DBS0_9TELE|nr:hypothetical protein NHX12_014243 [Muraenolepis orangiensis]